MEGVSKFDLFSVEPISPNTKSKATSNMRNLKWWERAVPLPAAFLKKKKKTHYQNTSIQSIHSVTQKEMSNFPPKVAFFRFSFHSASSVSAVCHEVLYNNHDKHLQEPTAVSNSSKGLRSSCCRIKLSLMILRGVLFT